MSEAMMCFGFPGRVDFRISKSLKKKEEPDKVLKTEAIHHIGEQYQCLADLLQNLKRFYF